MDISKLPRLSKSDAPPTPAEPDPQQPLPVAPVAHEYTRPRAEGVGVEVWFATLIGLALMLYVRSFGVYLFDLATHRPFHTGATWTEGPKEGTEVSYPELQGGTFYSDGSIFLFGFALLLSGFARAVSVTNLRGRIVLMALALVVTVLALGFNVYTASRLFGDGITPLIQILIIAFAGYIAYLQLLDLKAARA